MRPFKWLRANWIMASLGGVILGSALIMFLLAFCYKAERDIYINLATDVIMSGITVFGIDQILKLNRNKDWKAAETVARDEMETLAVELITYIATPLSLPFEEELKHKYDEFLKYDDFLTRLIEWHMLKVRVGSLELLAQLRND